MNTINKFLMISAVVLVVACESDPSDNLQDSLDGNTVDTNSIGTTLAINATSQAVGTATTFSNYDPGNSLIPSAIDILLSGSSDGTLNIPIGENDPQESVKTALNALDGFSTVTPISTGFTGALDAATITPAAVRVFEVGLSRLGGAVVSIESELTFGVDFVAALSSVDTTNQTLVVVPLKPLKPKTSYYVVVTNSLKDIAGDSVGASPTYTLLKNPSVTYVDEDGVSLLPGVPDESAATLEILRQLVSASEFTADFEYEDLAAVNIVVSWSFTTQSIGDVLTQVRDDIRAGAVPATALVDSTTDSPFAAADIYVGTVDVPYYLAAATGANDPTPLATFWQGAGGSHLTRFNTTAIATSSQTIPLMLSLPKSAMPASGYPIVIYQHGITTNRATMLAVADAFASAGIAVAAIDMPLHGLTGLETNGTAAFKTANERTFDIDLVTQDMAGSITAAAPDGIIDSSGRHYINLTSLLTSRDNIRQSIADLFSLTYAIEGLTAGTATFDSTRIYFLGHSLGAIVGGTFTALESNVRDAVFAFGAGGIVKVLDGSAAFGPEIAAGLAAAAGITKGTPAFESFLGAAQTVIDSGDSVNYASSLATKAQGILYFEIVGDGTPGTSDLVVPNTVPDALAAISTPATVSAPLAGTEPLLTLMGLTQVNSTQTGADLKLSVKFTSGDHGSILDPTADPAVTTELQTQMASFLAQDGNALPVDNTGVIQTP